MKRYSLAILVFVFLAGFVFTACSDEGDDNFVPSRDCYIKNITLGTLEQTLTTKDSKGNDSTYTREIPGANFPLSIDQINMRVYNVDSLPKGIDITKILLANLNVTGYATIKSLATGADTTITTQDSIDFSQPRILTVHATDQAFSRNYTIEIRVHKEFGDSIRWKNLTPSAPSPLNSFTVCRILPSAGRLYIFGQTDNGAAQVIGTETANPDFSQSSAVATAGGKAIDIRTIRLFDQYFYGLSEGMLYRTQQISDPWQKVEGNLSHFDALPAQSADSIYALDKGVIYTSANGHDWTVSAADPIDKWPATEIVSTSFNTSSLYNEYALLIAGKRDNGVAVWQKTFSKNSYFVNPWMFMPQTEELNEYAYPALTEQTMVTYDSLPTVFGRSDKTGKLTFYKSTDNGRTWRITGLKYPLTTAQGYTGIAVDDENFIWSVTCGTAQVYKGRHNRLGWTATPKQID